MDTEICGEPSSNNLDALIAELAARQYDLFTRQQAVNIGFSSRQIDRDRVANLASWGWAVVPVTWEHVTRTPDEWLAKLARTLAFAA